MKLNSHQLAKLNVEYNKLKKADKIISLGEVKKRINDIVEAQEKLEELLSEQRNALEVEFDDSGCVSGSCEIEETSELYDFYDEIEDMVIDGRFYKVLYMVN